MGTRTGCLPFTRETVTTRLTRPYRGPSRVLPLTSGYVRERVRERNRRLSSSPVHLSSDEIFRFPVDVVSGKLTIYGIIQSACLLRIPKLELTPIPSLVLTRSPDLQGLTPSVTTTISLCYSRVYVLTCKTSLPLTGHHGTRRSKVELRDFHLG